MKRSAALVCTVLILGLAAVTRAASPITPVITRGKYLVTIMDCGGCHTPGALRGKPDPARLLAGSDVGFAGPPPPGAATGGVVYPPNLTPDKDTGLGKWTDEQIIRAVRFGQRPDGRALSPAMPWPAYSALTDADARALVAYLRSIPAVAFRAPGNVAPGETPTAAYLKLVEGQ